MSLPIFSLKEYQRATLASLRKFLEKTVELNDADAAFYAVAKRRFEPPPNMPGLPYVCLRVPTGGGKTISRGAFRRHRSRQLPSNRHAIGSVAGSLANDPRTTLATLQDRAHANRRALAERFGENVRIMGVAERFTPSGRITMAARLSSSPRFRPFAFEETEGRKVYESNGELMDHFTGSRKACGPFSSPGRRATLFPRSRMCCACVARWSSSTKRTMP